MIAKVRTIRQTLAAIKEIDPHTAITESALRRLIAEKRLSATYIGTKALLSEEEVMSFFKLGTFDEEGGNKNDK